MKFKFDIYDKKALIKKALQFNNVTYSVMKCFWETQFAGTSGATYDTYDPLTCGDPEKEWQFCLEDGEFNTWLEGNETWKT